MRILHTSDLHLNALRGYRYLERADRMLRDLDVIADQHKVDCIVVAGDAFDRPDLTNAERQLLSDWLARTNFTVIMISGNHDKRSVAIGDTCLSHLSVLNLGHVIHDGQPMVLKRDDFDCAFVLLPYQGWSDQEAFLIYETMIPEARKSGKPVVVVQHEAMRGCKADNDIEVTKKHQIRLTARDDVVYWALGDMHSAQPILPNAYYSGAPHQINFGEQRRKGCLIVDTDDPENPGFVDVQSWPLLRLDDVPETWPDAFVQLTTPDYRGTLPVNVRYSPDVQQHEVPVVQGQIVGPLSGIESVLGRAGLAPALLERTIGMAEEILHNVS